MVDRGEHEKSVSTGQGINLEKCVFNGCKITLVVNDKEQIIIKTILIGWDFCGLDFTYLIKISDENTGDFHRQISYIISFYYGVWSRYLKNILWLNG